MFPGIRQSLETSWRVLVMGRATPGIEMERVYRSALKEKVAFCPGGAFYTSEEQEVGAMRFNCSRPSEEELAGGSRFWAGCCSKVNAREHTGTRDQKSALWAFPCYQVLAFPRSLGVPGAKKLQLFKFLPSTSFNVFESIFTRPTPPLDVAWLPGSDHIWGSTLVTKRIERRTPRIRQCTAMDAPPGDIARR
jgi:hypothetical protein